MRHVQEIAAYKFPGCQKYWTAKRPNSYRENGSPHDDYVFDISMGYSMFYFKGKTIEEAEDCLLDFIKEEVHEKLIAAKRLVAKLDEFVEDEQMLSREQLLEKYKKNI